MKRVILSFWTRPMQADKEKANTLLLALSLAYAKQSGYEVVLYTDEKGNSMVGHLPFDEVKVTLDEIPEIANPSTMFAASKFFALKDEPLGVIHIDYDVFIKKPCLDMFFDGDMDGIAQMKEPWVTEIYSIDAQWMYKHGAVKGLPLVINPEAALNTGVIGFKNQELKDKMINTYMEAFKKYAVYSERPALDFYLEQYHMLLLSKDYDVRLLLQQPGFTKEVTDEANEIGFCHLISHRKYDNAVIADVERVLKNKFPETYKLLKI